MLLPAGGRHGIIMMDIFSRLSRISSRLSIRCTSQHRRLDCHWLISQHKQREFFIRKMQIFFSRLHKQALHITSHPSRVETNLLTSNIEYRLMLISSFNINAFFDEGFCSFFTAIPVHGFLCKLRRFYDRPAIDGSLLCSIFAALMSRNRAWCCYLIPLMFAPFQWLYYLGKLSS